MHTDHEQFIEGINSQKRIVLRFHSKQDGGELVRTCAPLDFGPSRRSHDKSDRYHFWDYDSDTKMHILSLMPSQVIKMEMQQEGFNPAEFVTWNVKASPWFFLRDWGVYS